MLGSFTEILGMLVTVYGLGAALSVLLQARTLLRRGTSEDVSVQFLAAYVGGYALWLVYGVAIGSVPIIVVDAVGLAAGTTTLAVAIHLRRCAAGRPASARPGRAPALRLACGPS